MTEAASTYAATVRQPAPSDSDHPPIVDLVMNDLEARSRLGAAEYGCLLHGFNGREALVDAYQEALDLAMYLRQALYEAEHGQSVVPESVPSTKDCPQCQHCQREQQGPSLWVYRCGLGQADFGQADQCGQFAPTFVWPSAKRRGFPFCGGDPE